MRKVLLFTMLTLLGFTSYGQSYANESLSLQACQEDTIVFKFDITSPFAVGNTFVVEISDNSGNFNGSLVSIAPLSAWGVSVGNEIDVYIPENQPQGVYSFRVVPSANPGVFSDTISNVIIGANPKTNITAYDFWDRAGFMNFCAGDTMLLVAEKEPPGQTYTYQWLDNGGIMGGETNDTMFVSKSGTYSVEVSSNLCDAVSNDTIVQEYNTPTFLFANSTVGVNYIGFDSIQMCEGTVATLEHSGFLAPGMNGFTYQWLKNDSINILGDTVWYPLVNDTLNQLNVTEEGKYYLEVTSDPGGCVDTSMFFSVFVDTIPDVVVLNQPWPSQTLPKTTLCLTDSTLLTATDTVLNDSWEYQWQVAYPSGSGSWLNLPNDTLPWLTVDTSIVADTADYRLYIRNETCDFISNETTINFVPFPTMSFLPGDSLGICAYDSVLVSIQSNAINFSWNGGLYVGKQNFIPNAGQYIVEAFGINQCRTVDTLIIYENSIFAIATASPQVISPGETTTLSSSGGVGYYWFADSPSSYSNQLGASTIALPTEDTTTYFIEVEDINGCTDTASVMVYVSEQDSAVIYANTYGNIQNVITPNGDGMNDVLDLSAITDGDDCEFTVYTRWGTPVFSQEIYNNAWGGTTDGGAILNDGTYYFVLTFDNKIRVKSAITILNNF